MLACESQTLAALSIKTLEKIRCDDSFDFISDLTKRNPASSDLATIPRKHKKPAKYLGDQETLQYSDITEAKLMYKRVYLTCIKEWFIDLAKFQGMPKSREVAHWRNSS